MYVDLNWEVRKEVVDNLQKYQWCVHSLKEEDMPRVEPSFKLVWPAHVSKVKRDEGDPYIQHVDRIVTAVNRLFELERELVVKRYLLEEELDDRSVYEEMILSRSAYYEFKKKALSKLAFAFRICVQ
ncbi:ArpU family phage packaging/lysis transcriptional regulator [Bacillus sp. FSL W7-1360]